MERNFKWFIPFLGLVALLAFAGFFVLIASLIKSSDAYSGAIARVRSSPAVIAVVGTPMKDSFLANVQISESGSSGTADMAIPISGPKGTAKVYVSAKKSLGQWHYNKLIVRVVATKQEIDLSETNSVQ